MVERFDPLIVLASIHKERCTALYGVPTMFIAELNHPMFDMFDMSSLRTGIMAGSLCPVELMKKVEEKMFMKVTSVYGLTEASPGMTHSRIDDSFEVRCNTVGHDFEFTEVKVLDPETGEECPVGVQGEMCNRGYNTMKGYYKNPQATAEVIDKNGFLHSGDLGVKDENTSVSLYKDLFEKVKAGIVWEGKLKKISKTKEDFYIYLTVLPIHCKITSLIKEFIWISFLTTNEELEEKEFKKRVVKNMYENRRINNEAREKIDFLMNKISEYSNMKNSLFTEKERASKFFNQIRFYEKETEVSDYKMSETSVF
jgi:hypothetical protein